MHPRDDVIISYSNLAPDTTLSGQPCPKCRGGTHGERAMSVGRTGPFLWWLCHRASCGFRGKHRVAGVGEYVETTDEKRGRYRDFKRGPIPPTIKQRLCDKFNLQPDSLDLAKWQYTPDYDGHGKRIIMPILNANGAVRGEAFRSYWKAEPKMLINMDLKESGICWYKFRKYGRVLVVCEDQPSALRVAQANVDAVALLGTNLNVERVFEIRDQEYSRVWLSLDRDAASSVMKQMAEFSGYLPALRAKPLEGEDIKDMSPEQFELYINEVLQI